MRQEKCAKMQTFADEEWWGRGDWWLGEWLKGGPGQGYGLSSRLTLYV